MSRNSALNLIQWLRGLGGFVDERITVAVSAGSRGLVATAPIRDTTRPLVAIPEPLVLTPAAALFSLGRSGVLCESGVDSLASYAAGDLAAPISLVLAADAVRIAKAKRSRKEGENSLNNGGGGEWRMSPWGAYTASLSPPPSLGKDEEKENEEEEEEEEGQNSSSGCAGWFLPPKVREAALARCFSSASRRKQISEMLDEALRIERAAAEATVEAAFLGGQGKEKEGKRGVEELIITAELLTWARSQIVSRAFAAPFSSSSSGEDGETQIVPALLPVIDLCNHSPRGGFPAWGVVSSSSDASPSSPSRLCWLRNAAPLSAGEELTTDYSRLCGWEDGGLWMASYGFLPAGAK